MLVQELRKKSDDDLKKMISETREKILTLQFKIARREVKNYNLLKQAKREVARMLTILKERK